MATIKEILDATSNNYSGLDKIFQKATGKLLDSKSAYTGKRFVPVSVVIPYYKDGIRVINTLEALNQQSLTDTEMHQVQVVLVDDGSNDELEQYLCGKVYRFELVTILRKENKGRSFTRNEGFAQARHNIIVCIDSDVLVARNFLREHVVRNLACPGNVFVGLIHNIDELNGQATDLTKCAGLSAPTKYNEYRIDPLVQTSNFRDMGCGRRIGMYDIAGMVSTCSMSCARSLWSKLNGFSTEFIGWGLEDTYFGAKSIVFGAKIVPVLSTGAYHLNHPPRSGSEKARDIELKYNINLYERLVQQRIEDNK